MSPKPDDIPQTIWDEACILLMGRASLDQHDQEWIARAILAAKAEERESCAVVAEGVQQRSNHPAWGATYDLTPAEIAAAIRNRENPVN